MRSGRTQLVFFAAATTLLLLNYPWLSLFSSHHMVFGLPPLVLYLFGLWLGFIVVVRLIVDSPQPTGDTDDETEDDPRA
ncbi:hypothetical protein [Motiliproteus sediminis]|uniref:hypothetical protein n=1 Tax=Motiliproteus sediminis TaxID=1468178 RepID=UPI001AF01C67|nr:hypothetical protein [Motiliproteus sediminis]